MRGKGERAIELEECETMEGLDHYKNRGSNRHGRYIKMDGSIGCIYDDDGELISWEEAKNELERELRLKLDKELQQELTRKKDHYCNDFVDSLQDI